MDELRKETQRLLQTTRSQLEALESAYKQQTLPPQASYDIYQSYMTNLNTLSHNITQLKYLLKDEGINRIEYWRQRLRHFEEEIFELRSGSNTFGVYFRQEEERRNLLGGAGSGDMMRRRGTGGVDGGAAGGDTVVDFGLLDEKHSLKQSSKGVDNILDVGRGALEMLVSQRRTLKGAHGKMVGVLKGMGVSRKLIHQIERRDQADFWLVVILMVTLLLLVFIIWILKKLWE